MTIIMWVISIFSSFLGPLVFLLIFRERRFVYGSSAQALTFHLILAVVVIASIILTLGLGAIITAPLGTILGIGVPVVAAISVSNGRFYDVPITGALSRKFFSY